jgi:hypothetical protein
MRKFVILVAAIIMAAYTLGGIVKANEPTSSFNDNQKISMADFESLQGDGWSGTLSYLNYKSKERSSIPVALSIDTSRRYAVKYSIKYPGEEQYNDTSKIKISKDGLKIDGKPVVARIVLDTGAIQMVTAFRDKDDNRAADIRMTYTTSTN